MGGEIITVHLGQAGVQMSHALWELVCVEHGVSADGKGTIDAIQSADVETGRDYVFREVPRGKFVPRALLVDLEPTVIDEVRTGVYRNLWHPQQLINGKEDAASNFARGYYSQSRFEMSDVMDRIRILSEQCDNMVCFKLLYSANGGTGSGLTSALCERLSDEYGKKHKFATTVYPSPGYSELMVEPYNALLHSSTNLTFCDCVVITDNEAMLNVVEDALKVRHAGFTVPNRVIANAITTQFLSHRYKFIGQQHFHVDELLINLIPYPRIHFPMMAFAPFLGPTCHDFEKSSALDLVRSVFEDTNQLLSVSAVRRAYISCCLLFRGPISPLEAINSVATIKGDRMCRARFVDWCPTGFKVGVNFAPPVQATQSNTVSVRDSSLSMIAGNLSIRDVWTGIGRRFDQLYEKRAYVHWYVAEGMEEGEFTLAREVIQQLVEDYEAIAKDAEGAFFDTSMNQSENNMSKTAQLTPMIKPSPHYPTDLNVNQATTLDDQNSLRTLENNEDNLSLDTNQHHSDVFNQQELYRSNGLRTIREIPHSVNRNPMSHSHRIPFDPRYYSNRRRRLRFPELPHQEYIPEAYKAERNQISSNALWEPRTRPKVNIPKKCQSVGITRVREGHIPYRNNNIYSKPNVISYRIGGREGSRTSPQCIEKLSQDDEHDHHGSYNVAVESHHERLGSASNSVSYRTDRAEKSLNSTPTPSTRSNIKHPDRTSAYFEQQCDMSPNSIYDFGSMPEMRITSKHIDPWIHHTHRQNGVSNSVISDCLPKVTSLAATSSPHICNHTGYSNSSNIDKLHRSGSMFLSDHQKAHQRHMSKCCEKRHCVSEKDYSFREHTKHEKMDEFILEDEDASEMTQMYTDIVKYGTSEEHEDHISENSDSYRNVQSECTMDAVDLKSMKRLLRSSTRYEQIRLNTSGGLGNTKVASCIIQLKPPTNTTTTTYGTMESNRHQSQDEIYYSEAENQGNTHVCQAKNPTPDIHTISNQFDTPKAKFRATRIIKIRSSTDLHSDDGDESSIQL